MPEILASLNASARAQAFAIAHPEMLALDKDRLLTVYVDIKHAVTVILHAVPGIQAQRVRMLALPEFDIRNVDMLLTYARAAAYVDRLYPAELKPKEDPTEAAALTLGVEKRDLLLHEVKGFAMRKLVDDSCVRTLPMTVGYRHVAFSIARCSDVIREVWPLVRSSMTLADLDDADALAERLMVIAGERDGVTSQSEGSVMRQRAFTLLMNAYEQAARAITFLHWNSPVADVLVPSVARKRRVAKAADQEQEQEKDWVEEGSAPDDEDEAAAQ